MGVGECDKTTKLAFLEAASLGSVKLLQYHCRAFVQSSLEEFRDWWKRRQQIDRASSRGSKKRTTAERSGEDRTRARAESEDVPGKAEEENADFFNFLELAKSCREFKRAKYGEDVGDRRRESAGYSSEGKYVSETHFQNSRKGAPDSTDESGGEVDGDSTSKQRFKNVFLTIALKNFVNCRDADGSTPLHKACKAGSKKAVKYLISQGADVDVTDINLNTPLHIAAKLGPPSIVSVLKHHTASMGLRNLIGVTPRDILKEKEAAEKIAAEMKDRQQDSQQDQWHSKMADEQFSSEVDNDWFSTYWDEDEARLSPGWERSADRFQSPSEEFSSPRDFVSPPKAMPGWERSADRFQSPSEEFSSPRDFVSPPKAMPGNSSEKSSSKAKHSRSTTDDKKKSESVPNSELSFKTPSYSHRWKIFSESYNLCLAYSNVPFPVEEGKEGELAQVLFQDVHPSKHKWVLRNEMLKWHPDKFMQKWDRKVVGPDHDQIVKRVNEISDAILQLYRSLCP